MADDVAEIEAKIRALGVDERALIRALIADLDGPEDEAGSSKLGWKRSKGATAS